jgi:prevent-host-death family protein
MPEIGAYEAKTHLPRLLERVANGERFVITKHGRPVAELVPVGPRDVTQIKEAIADIRKLRGALARRGIRLKTILGDGESLRDLMHRGQRY